jgi:hypothetical protein
LNATEMAQVPSTGNNEPHVWITAKSPLTAMLAMAKTAWPSLLTVTACGALVVPNSWSAKVTLVVERVTLGAATPVPVRSMKSGVPYALLAMVIVPLRGPKSAGVKVMLSVQPAPGATVPAQSLAWAKSPLATMLLMANSASPMLASVTA